MGEGKDHILSRYDADLLAYRDHVLVMGRQALEQVRNAVQALTGPDVGLARQVLYRERRLNELDMAGQEEGIRLLTVHHPVANDLRLVLALTRSLSDLERIGNQGKKIARISLQNFDTELAAPDPALFADVPIMSEVATRMLADALAAWVKDDFETAVQVAQTDAKLDQLFESSLRRLSTYLFEDPRYIRSVVDAILAIKAVEAVGDNAAKLARHLIFVLRGSDVGHVNAESLTAEVLDRSPKHTDPPSG